ncbi:DEAD/DEAH box helicase [Rossellomorea vietnamensis]|uniref:DEAD/DEAH box helicase n=1 Tax=Rossellomorea vietnamensis TaxID=218284 RepID=UPI003CF24DB5
MKSTAIMIQQWKNALIAEIQTLKEYEGRGILVLKGQHLATSEGGAVYWLVMAYPASLFAGGSIVFEYNGKKAEGNILSSEGTDVIAELDLDLGAEIGKGILRNEPWDLLNKLIERLEEIEEDPSKMKTVKNVMNPPQQTFHPREKVQSTVHEAVLRSKYNPVTYIWGPPGTGKTYNLARAAAYQYVNDRKILLLSHSNAAIDVITLEMCRFLQENHKWTGGEVIRYGHPEKEELHSHPELNVAKLAELEDSITGERKRKFEKKRSILKKKLSNRFNITDSAKLTKIEVGLAKVREKLRKKEGAFLEEAKVVATTLSKAATDPLIYNSQFDLIIVDEASMAYAPQIAFAATLGTRVIICGDFKQLPPIAVSRHGLVGKWLKQDIFHLSGITDWVERRQSHPQLMLLPVQRRMHPDISAYTNELFYHSLVSDHPDTLHQRVSISNQSPFEKQAAVLMPVIDHLPWCITDSGSRWNLMNSLAAIQLMLAANASGISSIGYATPYRAQARWMNTIISIFFNKRDITITADIFASTVHKFQGSEKDMILFDITDSFPQEKAGALLTKKESGRLINVSVTRAKGKFILLGDDQFIKKHVSGEKPVRKLIHYLEKKGKTSNRDYASVFSPVHTKRLRWYEKNNTEKLMKDIDNAKFEIILSFEKVEDIPGEIWAAVKRGSNYKTIKILCKHKEGIPLTSFQLDSREYKHPFIGLDQKVLWFGSLQPGTANNKGFSYIPRVFSSRFFSAYVEGLY